ncbi:hypothetical protein E3N88_23883 [Mikania micrantha]|uniref:Reverse transcriptase Ty1/copia-type domain-containing protein n=1 Tax=Mikania micrantha TaxID=192012 RepID=A0A5N6NEK9_9ASTR|nr:hypothetical protein E3N88_23883 [Mikania micrantha]
MRWILSELDAAPDGPTQLFCDNQAARHIANNPVFHERTKHVEMDCYFVRERVESRYICLMPIATKDQIADILTKALGANTLRFLLCKLGVRDLHIHQYRTLKLNATASGVFTLNATASGVLGENA